MVGCGEGEGPLGDPKEEEGEDGDDDDDDDDDQGQSGFIGGGGSGNGGGPAEEPKSILGLWTRDRCLPPPPGEDEGEEGANLIGDDDDDDDDDDKDDEFEMESYEFLPDGTNNFTMTQFTEEGCIPGTERFTFKMQSSWVIGDPAPEAPGANHIDFVITGGSVLIQHEDALEFFNDGDGLCGKTDWVQGVETDIDGLACDPENGPPAVGDAQFDIVGFIDGDLHFGATHHYDDETMTEIEFDGLSAENRPVKLNSHEGYQKAPITQ
jgi:hypothetical protein